MSKDTKYFIGKASDSFFLETFELLKFTGRFWKVLFQPPFEVRETVRQCYEVGYRSLGLISLTGFVTGIVFTKQSRPSLSDFGATSWLPALMGVAIMRALAPLITSLISAGKVGSNIGAEIGSMRVSEQIDAMELSPVDPFKFLVVTRVVATTVMMPILAAYMAVVAIFGSYLNIHQNEQTSFTVFITNAFANLSFLDLEASLTKSILFGFTIGLVSCFKGYTATNGTEGVGRAANASVVVSMFFIFIEEVLIVQVFNLIRYA
ncbi:ABC transporter permease [Flaviaesturariibacter flavus]|uniref:ABC transporter permease n=1 Tax=Flaviaesturariibacter flavus TaxID=2502780 RepID=A0A4R1BC42_9BACT|nr:ABC transporter permease [Flaviaesturariibacter flavus]TCJ14600.1 ABC transporter permease [Flaviaesturariibacter flavus]